MANKYDSALFIVGNTQKKRPENIVFGRIYAEHMLDMVEFGVQNYKSIDSFKNAEVSAVIKPLLVFQGEQFDFSQKHSRFKSLMIDFFKFSDYSEANIVELKRVIVFTTVGESKIQFR